MADKEWIYVVPTGWTEYTGGGVDPSVPLVHGHTIEQVAGLQTALDELTSAISGSNEYTMPVWNGVGTHPLRVNPLNGVVLPTSMVVTWRQPTAPLATAGYALPGDEWEPTPVA